MFVLEEFWNLQLNFEADLSSNGRAEILYSLDDITHSKSNMAEWFDNLNDDIFMIR